jgi:hypothetical protein
MLIEFVEAHRRLKKVKKIRIKFSLEILKNALRKKKTLRKFLIIDLRKSFHLPFCPAIRSNNL